MATDVPAVSAAVRIIESLARSFPEPVSPTVLVSELNLNRSTCYNIIATLQRAGWVSVQTGRPGWSLGPRLLTLTGVSDRAQMEIAQKEITALSAELGFVVFVTDVHPRSGYHVLAVADQGTGVRVTVSVGEVFPLAAPALLHSWLAWAPESEIDRLLDAGAITGFTTKTVTGRSDLVRALALVRERGYAESIQQYNLAQSGVASPIFDREGRVRAVVCSLAFSSDLDASNIATAGEGVRRCANAITERTGGVVRVGSSTPGEVKGCDGIAMYELDVP